MNISRIRRRIARITAFMRGGWAGFAYGATHVGRLSVGPRVDLTLSQLACGRNVRLDDGCLIEGPVHLHDDVYVGRGCILLAGRARGGTIEIGESSVVYHGTCIYGAGTVSIGKMVRIGGHVDILSSNRIFDDPDTPTMYQGLRLEPVVFEDDIWVGAHSVILAGVTIGRGAVIAAGAVVTHDVPPLAVVAGVPARVIRTRSALDEPIAQ